MIAERCCQAATAAAALLLLHCHSWLDTDQPVGWFVLLLLLT
jgi:hypothetical protein